MKENFKEHYQYTKEELAKLWDDAYFVFDTNTLLNMYRYNRDTFNEYIKVLIELSNKKRLFLPNHVGKEFFKNRINVIQEYKKSYTELLNITTKFKAQLSSKYRHHPFVDIEQVTKDTEAALKSIEDKLTVQKEEHPDWLRNDDILTELTKIFDGCVGKPYTDQELQDIYKEGEVRYQRKIPPGFKDTEKGEERQYGDLVVWKQILDFAKSKNKPIIFITGDVKEDWWLINEGERLMPLPELKRELRIFAEVDFHAYTADYFLETYNEHSNSTSINTKAIDEVRKLREIQDLMSEEDNAFNEKVTFGKDRGDRYELFSLLIPRILDTVEHIQEIIPDISEEGSRSLESADRVIRTISRAIRTHGRVSNFYVNKLEISLHKIERTLKEYISQEGVDEDDERRVEKFNLEIHRIRKLLDRTRNAL